MSLFPQTTIRFVWLKKARGLNTSQLAGFGAESTDIFVQEIYGAEVLG